MDISILIFMAMTLGFVMLMKKSRGSTMIAFLFAGVFAGPHVLGLYEMSGVWNYLGELGIMFLWFSLGLELNVKRLWTMRRGIFGLGAAVVLATSAVMFPILFGLSGWTIMGAVMVCLILAMSSSGADLQTLADRNELATRVGRQAFSILLFQNLLTIPILAMLPIFAGVEFDLGAEIIDVGILTIGLIIGVVIFAKLIMNPLMKITAKMKSREAFLLLVLLSIAVCAAVFDFIGMPAAIGAFLAGMLFSETIYNHQVRADIAPYQMLFVGLFFIALGIGLDVPVIMRNIWVVIFGAAGLIALKSAAVYIVVRAKKASVREAALIALLLSQGGEFGLLILRTLKTANIEAVPFPHTEILTAVIIMSMIVSPFLLKFYDNYMRRYSENGLKKYVKPLGDKKPAVIICGFGRVGMTIAKMLKMRQISYVAIDLNVDNVVDGRGAGFNVVYGDTTRSDVLVAFGLAPRTTRAVIVALDNAAAQKKAVRASRRVAKNVKIFARARNLQESKILLAEGARVALPETIESSFMLGHEVLESMGASESEISAIMLRMRKYNYENNG